MVKLDDFQTKPNGEVWNLNIESYKEGDSRIYSKTKYKKKLDSGLQFKKSSTKLLIQTSTGYTPNGLQDNHDDATHQGYMLAPNDFKNVLQFVTLDIKKIDKKKGTVSFSFRGGLREKKRRCEGCGYVLTYQRNGAVYVSKIQYYKGGEVEEKRQIGQVPLGTGKIGLGGLCYNVTDTVSGKEKVVVKALISSLESDEWVEIGKTVDEGSWGNSTKCSTTPDIVLTFGSPIARFQTNKIKDFILMSAGVKEIIAPGSETPDPVCKKGFYYNREKKKCLPVLEPDPDIFEGEDDVKADITDIVGSVKVGDIVVLDGSGSSGPVKRFEYKQLAGSTAVLQVHPTLQFSNQFVVTQAMAGQTLQFELTVFGEETTNIDSDEISVTVQALPVNKVLVHNLTGTETRTVIPIQMLQPDGSWSAPIKYNFDTGASWPTDVAPQMLTAFGFGPDGVGEDGSLRREQPSKIKIVGLDGEFDLPVMVQDKAHYDLFREQPPPTRYPLLRIRDILNQVTMVFESTKTTLRLRDVPIPELADPTKLITLPDFASRTGTPTSGWQWMRVKFVNPSDSTKNVEDWFGLNTGDDEIILKKESLGDAIGLPLVQKDDCNFSSKCTLEFIEASKPVVLTNEVVEVRKESCRFARGGDPRNIGGGVIFLKKYTMILWDLHRALLPVGTIVVQPVINLNFPTSIEMLKTGTIDASQSIADVLTLAQTTTKNINLQPVTGTNWKWIFVPPTETGSYQLGFHSEAKKGTTQITRDVNIQVTTTTTPPGDEFDAFGMKYLMKPTGRKVAMEEGSEHRNGKRYNVNHKFENHLMQGFYKLGQGQEKIETKEDGPNHGGCDFTTDQICFWWEAGINLATGKGESQYEWPHADNYPIADSKNDVIDTVGPLPAGRIVGWATTAYWGADGLRHYKAWCDPMAFPNNDPTQKPNNNWKLVIHLRHTADLITNPEPIIIPRDMQKVINHDNGFECEIRMHRGTNGDTRMYNAWVFEVVPPTS